MRLEQITLSGFRGFAREQTFDLSADVILIGGPNGSGKTSLLDAVLWAQTGSVGRLNGGDSAIVSRYAPTGEARVELTMISASGSPLRIVRRFDGETSLLVAVDDTQATGPAAEALLIENLWPDTARSSNPSESLGESITRAVYLQQDQVRSFLDAEDEQSRFRIVSEIIGAGRVSELVRQLESGRPAWTKSTNQLRERLTPLVNRRDQLAHVVARLSDASDNSGDFDTRWHSWLKETGQLAGSIEPAPTSRQLVAETLLSSLTAIQQDLGTRVKRYEELDRLLGLRPEIVAMNLDRLIQITSDEERRRGKARQSLQEAEVAAAELRRQQVLEQEEIESLAALAQLAQRHLGDRCPVCTQKYDEEITRAHLLQLADAMPKGGSAAVIDVPTAAADLAAAEAAFAKAQLDQRQAEDSYAALNRWEEQVDQLCAEIEMSPGPDLSLTVRQARIKIEGDLVQLGSLREQGNALVVELARNEESERLNDAIPQLEMLEAEVIELESEVELRERVGDDASEVHEALRELSQSLVSAELERIEPLLQRIYASVDPHPSFRAVSFLTRMSRGRGRLWTSIADRTQDDVVTDPGSVLSSSQMNVLAVVVFLALNLSAAEMPVATLALDDPLQSLDDVNLLGLADLLRRVRDTRQVILTTHDKGLAGLLERKLRPVELGQRTIVYEIDGWTRSGPSVEQREVPIDSAGLRLVKVG